MYSSQFNWSKKKGCPASKIVVYAVLSYNFPDAPDHLKMKLTWTANFRGDSGPIGAFIYCDTLNDIADQPQLS